MSFNSLNLRAIAPRNIRLVPICAAKPTDAASKSRRTRKPAASPSSAASEEPPSSSASTDASSPSTTLNRLHHGTSDTLRVLLERRAERQRKQLSPSTPSQTTLAASRPEPPSQKSKVEVKFCIQFRVEYGQSLVLVGGSPELGSWILADGVSLAWTDGDVWTSTVSLPAGAVVEYKYVVVGQGGHAVMWQQGNNSILALRQSDDVIEVHDNWYGNPGAAVVAPGTAPVTRENRLLSWATELEAQVAGQRQELRRARMELVAAQEDARLAREESKKLKVQLAKSEADRVAAVANLKQAATVNQMLTSQLEQTQGSFNEALETAIEILGKTAPKRASKKAAVEGTTTTTSATSSNGNGTTSNGNTSIKKEIVGNTVR